MTRATPKPKQPKQPKPKLTWYLTVWGTDLETQVYEFPAQTQTAARAKARKAISAIHVETYPEGQRRALRSPYKGAINGELAYAVADTDQEPITTMTVRRDFWWDGAKFTPVLTF